MLGNFFNMVAFFALILSSGIHSVVSSSSKAFPHGFIFGAASGVHRINTWSTDVPLMPEELDNATLNDVKSFQWEEDVRIASDLGIHFYRFTICWSCLFPLGKTNEINEAALNYYNQLIDGLLEAGIEPMVTLYNQEMPIGFQELGGWMNPLISDLFSDYAREVFLLFGERVNLWITINNPQMICDPGYIDGNIVTNEAFDSFYCIKNVMLAHAKAYRIYDEEYRKSCGGRVSIANHLVWFEANSPEDEDLAEIVMDYTANRYCHPIYSRQGGWPSSTEEMIWEMNKNHGWNESSLLMFTAAEKKFIRGTADFFSLSYYTSRTVRRAKPGEKIDNLKFLQLPELNVIMDIPAEGYYSASSSLIMYPDGLRSVLYWIQKTYGDWKILVTENGYPTTGLELHDTNRVIALREHLEQVHLSIYQDGIDVIGYTVRSLMDNFESLYENRIRFGLYEINFKAPEFKIMPRNSAKYYNCVISGNSFDVPEECFNDIDSTRSKRQLNFPRPNIFKSIEFMKEVYENRRCIVKVMGLAMKMMSIMQTN